MGKNKADEAGGLVFVGGFFIGFAVGVLMGRYDVAAFLALGIGFLGMAAVRLKSK